MIRRAAFVGIVQLAAAAPASAAADGGVLAQLIYPALNLALLIAVLVYFARAPIRRYFAERRDRIRDDIETAARLRAEAEQRYSEWQRRLREVDAELEGIRATARQRADAERERILSDAAAGAERIRREARDAVEQELRRAREQLKQEASDLALGLAAELLTEQVTDSDRDRLFDDFIQRLEQGTGARRGAGR
ncbi:MAG: F0F1 ATP synthase subunit B [Myxococcota bacterium]